MITNIDITTVTSSSSVICRYKLVRSLAMHMISAGASLFDEASQEVISSSSSSPSSVSFPLSNPFDFMCVFSGDYSDDDDDDDNSFLPLIDINDDSDWCCDDYIDSLYYASIIRKGQAIDTARPQVAEVAVMPEVFPYTNSRRTLVSSLLHENDRRLGNAIMDW